MATDTAVATVASAALPEPVIRRGISESQWRTLFNLFPGGKPDSVLMVWDYCRSRQLDPMKKPCHIVPMKVKGTDGQWNWRDVVMPGIYEYRITAQRTGLYLGHTEPELGPEFEYLGVKAPTWCAMTFYRWNEKAREKVAFPVKVWFAEVVGTSFDKNEKKDYVNDRWSRAPIQMLTKCAEAAGLRETFPEELGGEQTAEEMDGRVIGGGGDDDSTTRGPVKPAQRRAPAPEATVATVEAPVVEPEPEQPPPTQERSDTASASPDGIVTPQHIGLITDIKILPSGAAAVTLNTGFRCGTKDPDFMAALTQHADGKVLVELITRAPRDPKFAPVITEIIPIRDGEVS